MTIQQHKFSTLAEPIYLLYDARMLKHRPIGWKKPKSFPRYRDQAEDDYPIENPERVKVIYERLCNLNNRLIGDCGLLYKHLRCRLASKEEILFAHSEAQYNRLAQLEFLTDEELHAMSEDPKSDMYYNRKSFEVARLAAGGLLTCVDAICAPRTTAKKSVALVRPPGHHACQSKEMGVVVAAKYALKNHKAKRVAILDWDIHDGNATAEATIENENIFRIDLHRYNPKHPFYPFTGSPRDVGAGKAKGLNLNVAWSQGAMGNREYAAAFYELVLPLLADYRPDLLIISCGLDAAMGDLLGDCSLTPGFFHAMTRAALETVGPKTPVLLALEGGYTISVIPDCMEAVTLAMLNLPFFCHSGQEMLPIYSSCTSSGAAEPAPNAPFQVWSPENALDRSRHVLSKYYVRLESLSLQLSKSAVNDINNSIRIFHGLRRWKHLPLKLIYDPSSYLSGHKRAHYETYPYYAAYGAVWPIPFARPRIYLWYGTEKHHGKKPYTQRHL
jgi:acetoin utilization deacetylase AcuC-like enzyme